MNMFSDLNDLTHLHFQLDNIYDPIVTSMYYIVICSCYIDLIVTIHFNPLMSLRSKAMVVFTWWLSGW